MSILDAKDLADRYRQGYEDKVDEETRTSRQLITELGGEEPYNILKTYSGFGLDPEEVSIRTRLDKKYDRPARTEIRGGLKLKDMTDLESLQKRQEVSDLLKDYGAAGRLGKGLVAAEILAGIPAGVRMAPRLYKGFKEKVAPFIFPGVAIPGTVGALSQSEAEAAKISSGKKAIDLLEPVLRPTKYADVDTTSQDFIDYVEKFQIQNTTPQNQKTAYAAFNTVRNNFFKQNKDYDGVEEAWNYVTDFTAQQKAAGIKGATKDYTRVMQRYIDEVDAKSIIDETTGKQISLDNWFIPKNMDGSIASNPDKARTRLLQGRAKWNEIRNDKRVKKMEGYDTVGKQQVDRLLLYMKRGGEDNFKRIYDDKGNIIGFKVLNKTEPGFGNTYYKTGYVNKNPQLNLTSIKEHPTWQLQQNMMEIAQDVRFATLDDNISQQIFDVIGDFSIYGERGKTFGLNQLGDYLYTLDKYKDPRAANLAAFKSLGQKNIIEIHHTKGVSSSATDPNFLQLVTKKENAIANSIASGFYKNVERVGVEEAIKIAKKRAANFPNVKMVFEVNGQTFKIGKDTKPNKIVDRVKSEINELWSKHLEGKPEEIINVKDSYTGKFLKPLLDNKFKKTA